MGLTAERGAYTLPTYEYHAIRAEGDEEHEHSKSFVGGIVIARDRHEAKAKLREQGLKATMLKRARGIMAVIKWIDADIR
jgi:type II secretory pathway component PulF